MFDFNSEAVDRLCEAFLSLKDKRECRAFLEDICTIGEFQDMAQRLTAAKLLHEGRNYQQISEELGISTATISRVNRCLNYGAGGYRMVLFRMDQKEIMAEYEEGISGKSESGGEEGV
ncbi:MAG: helix-turn-helix domain-containing protein [Clostridia bacterium]|nr:helix-turn-helix domain-containing protein [Clostridia bacterium]MBO7504260.1 helix-turn-helix domain-containing protein [Clostridia bacterium]MBO7657899.1 helix-turn-helix domain-containing protein [Clostridia bacterium]MBP5665242.1 helix-turn-helix domain-containing protein [Clostridia bacterium]